MTKPEFADDLAWHFAHEAAHLYQRQVFAGAGDAWIHEGQEQLGDQAIVDATRNGAFDVAYSCGLLVNLAVDHAIRNNTQNDGLYAVWREYLRSVRDGLAPGESAYLDAISKIGNAEIALWVRNQLRARRPLFE